MTAAVQQPDLRSFIVCDSLPEGCKAYLVNDNRHVPLLRAGEWVIIDPEDREPVEGELFVAQFGGAGGPQVVEAAIMTRSLEKWGQTMWAVGARHRGYNAAELGFGSQGQLIGDYPYLSEQLTQRFLGKVVGILQPLFVEPLRIAA